MIPELSDIRQNSPLTACMRLLNISSSESEAADGGPPPFSPRECKIKNFRNGC